MEMIDPLTNANLLSIAKNVWEKKFSAKKRRKKNTAAHSFSSHTGVWFMVTHQNIKLTQEWQKCRENVSYV